MLKSYGVVKWSGCHDLGLCGKYGVFDFNVLTVTLSKSEACKVVEVALAGNLTISPSSMTPVILNM